MFTGWVKVGHGEWIWTHNFLVREIDGWRGQIVSKHGFLFYFFLKNNIFSSFSLTPSLMCTGCKCRPRPNNTNSALSRVPSMFCSLKVKWFVDGFGFLRCLRPYLHLFLLFFFNFYSIISIGKKKMVKGLRQSAVQLFCFRLTFYYF